MPYAATAFTAVPSSSLASLPAEVSGAVADAGRCVVLEATSDERLVAYIVSSGDRRSVEVFYMADPALGYDPRLVLAASRFRMLGEQVFHDRYRMSPPEDQDPAERVHFMETCLYCPPDKGTYRLERVPGEVHEDQHGPLDLSERYAPSPAPGDWEFFLSFTTER